jgi:hypothetical protein
MNGWQELLLAIAVSGVILGFFTYHIVSWKLNELLRKHMLHNDVLIDQEKDICDLKPKVAGAFVDIASLFILSAGFDERVRNIEKHLGMEVSPDVDLIEILNKLDPEESV